MTKQETLLDFFRHFPYLNLFISSFGNFEKEFAAIGIVLMALEKGVWGTSFDELTALRTNEGADAVAKWDSERQAFWDNKMLISQFNRRNAWTLGLYGLFVQKPTALDDPDESLLAVFTRQDGGVIAAGYDELHEQGFVILGHDDSIMPTEKFFDLLMAKYQKQGFIPA